MNEAFDSWKGFKDAGFEETTNDRLRLGSGRCFCSVGRLKDELSVHFEPGVPGFASVDFRMPSKMQDIWQWAMYFSRHTVGTRNKLNRLHETMGDELPEDLAELLDIGFDDSERIVEVDDEEVEGADEQRVPGAKVGTELQIVRNRLARARSDAWEQLQRATQEHDLECVKDCAIRVERAVDLLAKLDEIAAFLEADIPVIPEDGNESEEVDDEVGRYDDEDEASDTEEEQADDDEIDDAGDEQDVVPDENPRERSESKGHCTNFAVTFPDGVRIGEAKASTTFALAIAAFGPERVAALGLEMAGDPIVTRERTAIKKMPQMVLEISGGWFVKTHSSTYTKMSFLRKIAVALKVDLKFELFRKEPLPKPIKKGRRGRPRKPKPRDPNRFQIGRVVKHFFPKVFSSGLVTEEEIGAFLSDESKRAFGTRGYPVLKVSTGAPDDHIVNGQRRYYADVVLERNGQKYLLTSQFITEDCEPILSWLASKGCDRAQMEDVGKGKELSPSLFDDLSVFVSKKEELEPSVQLTSTTTFHLESDDPPPSLFDGQVSSPAPDKAVSAESAMLKAGDYLAARDIKLKLRKIAKSHDYTPSALAQGLGVNRKEVKGWFKGRGIVRIEQFRALCRFMGVDAADFGVGRLIVGESCPPRKTPGFS